jgi:mono/diheme cytochrome c family protein
MPQESLFDLLDRVTFVAGFPERPVFARPIVEYHPSRVLPWSMSRKQPDHPQFGLVFRPSKLPMAGCEILNLVDVTRSGSQSSVPAWDRQVPRRLVRPRTPSVVESAATSMRHVAEFRKTDIPGQGIRRVRYLGFHDEDLGQRLSRVLGKNREGYFGIRRRVVFEGSRDGDREMTRPGSSLALCSRLALLAVVALVARPAELTAQSTDSLPKGVTAAMVEQGRKVFTGAGVCFACHGQDGTGGAAPSLADTVWVHNRGEYDKIVALIMTGVPLKESKSGIVMPPRGGSAISDEDLRAVAAYVWSLSHRKENH